MLCPKCKNEIENNAIKCNFCNTKVGSICKDCGAYNSITATECINCGKILIKKCKECGAANLPNVKICRKCGFEFVPMQSEEAKLQPVYNANTNSQQKVKTKLIEGIRSADAKIITLSGESGSGKNLVVRTVINEFKKAKLTWLFGGCTQVTQLTPFGYLQDILLTFFNINNFCADTLQLKKNSIKFFKKNFPALTNSEILDLLNLLYPENSDKYENIYYNKAKTFQIIKKIITTIIEKNRIVFVIDRFEYLDGMSFDFIKELLSDNEILENIKILIITSEAKPGLGLLTSPLINEDNYLDLNIATFTDSQVETLLKQYNKNYDKDFIKLISKISKGNPSIIEQIVFLKNDLERNLIKDITFDNIETLIGHRLNLLLREDLTSFRLLTAMSVLGVKFYPAMLENFDNNTPQEFERVICKLVEQGYITQLNNLCFEFKTFNIWKAIVSFVKNDENFENILNILYDTLSIYKQSSIALLAYIVQKLNNTDEAFGIWTLLMKQATYIGDIGLYIITQKQALKLIENKNNSFYQNVKKNIYTRIGKLLEPIDHCAAFEYLQTAIMMLDDSEENKHIELLGYLASCSIKIGNYWGAIECIDNVLNKLPDNMSLEKILIKSRQIKPLLKLGNYGQLINIVETELLPHIEKILTKGKDTNLIKISDLFEIWINLYFDYAEALVLQGDNKCLQVIQNIYEILDKNHCIEPNYLCKTNLLLALANSIRGDIKTSNKILDDILKEISLDSMDAFIVSRWNFIDILNKFYNKDYNTLHSELFNVAAYANNVNDNFTKNILKTLLAKILKDNNQNKKALEILEEQVAYFAKEKVATGVLLSWYLIAKIKLITNGTQFALDIAIKALDIAQGANINNYYFIALFNKLIGEIYLAKQDFESSKVYLEKSIIIAKQFDLQFILVKAYLMCAKLYQELALPKTSKRGTYIKQALKMFQEAKNVPAVNVSNALQKAIKEDINILTSFCKLNGIILKKENK